MVSGEKAGRGKERGRRLLLLSDIFITCQMCLWKEEASSEVLMGEVMSTRPRVKDIIVSIYKPQKLPPYSSAKVSFGQNMLCSLH